MQAQVENPPGRNAWFRANFSTGFFRFCISLKRKGRNMARQKRILVEDRRRTVAECSLKGWKTEAIAAKLGVSRALVNRDLRVIMARWRRAAVRDFDEARGEQLQKLELVEAEAWAAWQRSQNPIQSASLSDKQGVKQSRSSLKHTCGDPRFLEQVNKCILQRSVLLGLQPDAALQQESRNARISLEDRHDEIGKTAQEICRRLKKDPEAGTATAEVQPGDAGDGDQRGKVAHGAAPVIPGSDAAGSH